MNLNHLNKEELVDLLKAYDSYITTAADAGRLKTGWVPVCVSEFYSCEYQDVWRAGQNFDYMYDYDEQEAISKAKALLSFNNVEIFFENGFFQCRFDGEEKTRLIRNNICDIEDGDAFFIGTGLHYADGDAHQNFDEPDDPWIVYDVGGDCWFQEDIGEPSACIEALLLAQHAKESPKSTLDNLIQNAEKTASQRSGEPEKPHPLERQ